MPDYTNYSFEDFVLDSQFQRWVLANSPADQDFWTKWLQANPDKLDLVLAARQFVSQMHQAQEELSDEELAYEVSQIRIHRQQGQDFEESYPTPNQFATWLRIAAILTLVSLGTWFFLGRKTVDTPLMAYQQQAEQQTGPLQEIRNVTNANQLVRLPDGSQVTLYRGSQIRFPRTFAAQQREVFLVGEAFFDVVRRPKQPFMVYTNTLITKVLGTSFTVRAYADDKETRVIVKTGKVSVFKTPAAEKLGEPISKEPAFILTPNQQVVLDTKENQMNRSLVPKPVPVVTLANPSQLMVFEHTPVISVFRKLEAMYGVVMNYDADLLTNCELTAEFGPESLFEKLDLICRATESRYEIVDAQIVIYSKGCR